MKEQLKSDSRLKHLPSFVILGSNDQLCDSLKNAPPFRVDIFVRDRLFKTALKTKYRNRAQIEDDLMIYLSNIAPRFEDLCSAKQTHVSIISNCMVMAGNVFWHQIAK